MVNPGHRSNGCATCKLRRVKCDEARPQCRRCTMGKRICTGYREGPGKHPRSGEQISEVRGVCEDHSNEAVISPAAWNMVMETNRDRSHVGSSIISIVQTCFEGLIDQVHSLETRRLMLQNYEIAIKLLRSALAVNATDRSLAAPMCALALYEMVVASGWDEDTWRIHLDGCLALMQQSYQRVIEKASLEPLEQALRSIHNDTNTDFSLDTTTRNEKETAVLLLSIFRIRLRSLVWEFCTLMQSAIRPRKLDTLKLRLFMRRLLNDLGLLLPTGSRPSENMSCMQQLDCQALRVVAGSILIRCGNILDTTGSFDTTREYAKLNSLVRAAANEILILTAALYPWTQYSNVASVAHHNADVPRLSITSTPLSVIWPLFAAGIWAGNEIAQQESARETLFCIGKRYHIPLALHLAGSDTPSYRSASFGHRARDIISGMILVGEMDVPLAMELQTRLQTQNLLA